MRIVFLGSGEFGLPTLKRLRDKHHVAAVVSQPDKAAGRHRQLTPTPIAAWATEAGLPVLKPQDVNLASEIELLATFKADASVVIAFGQKLSPQLLAVLAGPGGLTINLHASLLPALRGAAPINWAILNGEPQTGISVIGLAQRMDAGPIYAQAATPIAHAETAGELHDRLALMGPDLIEAVLAQLQAGKLLPRPQEEAHATRAPKLGRADSQVSFDMTAEQFRRRVHGLTPWPGVHVHWHHAVDHGPAHDTELILRRVEAQTDLTTDAPPGRMIDSEHVAVRDGAVKLLEVQTPGGRPMRMDEFLRGHKLAEGDMLV